MPRTPGTRPKGSGIPAGGVGAGPARPLRPPFSAASLPTPEAKSKGHADAAALRALLAPHLEAAAAAWVRNLNSENPNASNTAAEKIVERLVGKVPQTISGDPTAPLTILTGVPRE